MIRHLMRFLLRSLNALYWKSLRVAAYAHSHLRSPDQAVYSWPEQAASLDLGEKLALFVHFDGQGVVRPYVRRYLTALRAAGLDILFVTNAEFLQPESLDALKGLCAGVLIRRNKGYDFAAMREGLRHFGLPRGNTKLLVIANDSVYGPFRPLEDMLARVDFDVADVWGATESWQARYHLQSYFLVAGPRALAHPRWAAFWRQVRPVASKNWVITKYEVGFTQWMIRSGISCAAIWPYSDLVHDIEPEQFLRDGDEGGVSIDPVRLARRQHAMRIRGAYAQHQPLNPTSDLWRQLLLDGFPFIKRELLRDNPTRVPDVIDWRDEIALIPGADISLIERDLQRLLKNRAP